MSTPGHRPDDHPAQPDHTAQQPAARPAAQTAAAGHPGGRHPEPGLGVSAPGGAASSAAGGRPDRFAAEPQRVPWVAVAVFAVLAIGLAWLVTLPLWLGDGLADPLFGVYALAMMYTPTVAALVVTLFIVRPKYRARYLGLTPFKPVVRSIVLILVWPLLFAALSIAGVWLAGAFGWVDVGFSLAAFEEPAAEVGMTAQTLLILQLVTLPLVVVQATFSAFGEELGWRGFLVSALSPLGFWPMALISGAIWGVWHAPLILLGYNFGRTDVVGVLMMVGFCFFVGVLLNWARMWCRNMWVAAAGHGALNATATIGFLFIAGDQADFDGFWQTAIGLPGWILMAVAIAIMAAFGLFGRRLPMPLVTVPAKELLGSAASHRAPVAAAPAWVQPPAGHTAARPPASPQSASQRAASPQSASQPAASPQSASQPPGSPESASQQPQQPPQ